MTADVSGMKRKLVRRTALVAGTMAADLRSQLRQAAPRQSGELTRSIKSSWGWTGPTTITIVVETGNLVQAKTTNTGAKRHIIRPRTPGGVLKFQMKGMNMVGQSFSGTMYARFVNHPGNKGTKWWDKQLTPPKVRNAHRRAIRSAPGV